MPGLPSSPLGPFNIAYSIVLVFLDKCMPCQTALSPFELVTSTSRNIMQLSPVDINS